MYVGEHGLELDPRAGEWAPRIAEFADSAGWPAERKRLSVAFHWRTAEDEQAALTELRAVAERALAAGLRPRWGRKVLEVRPPVDADKGTAIRRVLDEHGLRRALYAGDDTTDLDAFRGLDGLELAVRVAIVSEEGPNELGEGADIVLGGPRRLSTSSARSSDAPDRRGARADPRPLRRAEHPRVGGRDHRARVRRRDVQPEAPARRDAVHPQRSRLALIRKPMFPPDIWRPPGGGVKPGEDFVEAVKREALEETGLHVELDRYLVEARAVFHFGEPPLDWRTHVFSAQTTDEAIEPLDTVEIAEARWGTLEELAGPLRERLLATDRAFWRYRVALHDAALAALPT